MARPLRIDIADGVYHVTSRGLERREIVADEVDRGKATGVRSPLFIFRLRRGRRRR